MTLLACRIPAGSTHLFGCITQTDKARLIFWPPLPRHAQLLSEDGKRGVTDHVTLELASGKSHITSFNAAGDRNHYPEKSKWALDIRDDCSLSFWCSLFVPFTILEEQDHAISAEVPMPTSDAGRRVEEYKKCAASCRVETLELQPHEFSGDYLFCLFYLQTGKGLTTEGLQIDLRQQGLDSLVTGFRNDTPIAFSPTGLQIKDSRVIIFSAVPPGTANADVMCGFAKRTKGARGQSG